MIERVVEWLAAWCERRGKVLSITGKGGGPDGNGTEDVYLIRYYLVKSKWFNVFIHRFMRSDRDDVHDHPWDFFTYLVRGAYTEYRWDEKKGGLRQTRRTNYWIDKNVGWASKQNRLVFRRAETQHKVLTDRVYDPALYEDVKKAPLTICVTGPTRREWGFIKDMPQRAIYVGDGELKNGQTVRMYRGAPVTVREWVDWRTYLNVPNDPGRG